MVLDRNPGWDGDLPRRQLTWGPKPCKRSLWDLVGVGEAKQIIQRSHTGTSIGGYSGRGSALPQQSPSPGPSCLSWRSRIINCPTPRLVEADTLLTPTTQPQKGQNKLFFPQGASCQVFGQTHPSCNAQSASLMALLAGLLMTLASYSSTLSPGCLTGSGPCRAVGGGD